MRSLLAIVACCLCWVLPGAAATERFEFDIHATYANGDPVLARMSYSLPPFRKIGNDHYYLPDVETLSFRIRPGWWIHLSNVVTGFATLPDGRNDFWVSSFLGEGPNDWHIALFLRGRGIIGASQDLPRTFPLKFDIAQINAFKTDEYNRVREAEAEIQYILPKGTLPPVAAVPLPPSAGLLALAILGAGFWGRRATRAAARPHAAFTPCRSQAPSRP